MVERSMEQSMDRLGTLDAYSRDSRNAICGGLVCGLSCGLSCWAIALCGAISNADGQVRSFQFQPGGSIQVQGMNPAQAAAIALVSTEGPELMEIIEKTIEALDQSARPLDNMRVVRVSGGANPAAVHKALMGILGQQQNKQDPNQQKSPNQQQQQNKQPKNDKNNRFNNRQFDPGNSIQSFESNGMRIDTVVLQDRQQFGTTQLKSRSL